MMYQFVDYNSEKPISGVVTFEEAREFALDFLVREIEKYNNPFACYDERFSDLLLASVYAYEASEGDCSKMREYMNWFGLLLKEHHGVKLTIYDENEVHEYSCDNDENCLDNIKKRLVEYISNCIVWGYDVDKDKLVVYASEVEFMHEIVNCGSVNELMKLVNDRPDIKLEDE